MAAKKTAETKEEPAMTVTNNDNAKNRTLALKSHLTHHKTKLLIGLAVLVLAGFTLAYVNQIHTNDRLKKANQQLSNPQAAAKAETKQLTEQVGRLIELPANETPTVATVVDVTKLQSQAFFANAKNGDRVLIFTQAKKAILYRPSTGKIIQVAPINIGNNQSSQSQPQTTPKKSQ